MGVRINREEGGHVLTFERAAQILMTEDCKFLDISKDIFETPP